MEPSLMSSDIKPHDPEPNTSCMICGNDCETWEIVWIGGRMWDFWCWCENCNIDTFHMAHGYSEKEVKQGYGD